MTFEHTMTRRVEFYETDTAGIVHFSNYFRYFEAAEHSLFRSLNLKIHTGGHDGSSMEGWARVNASATYLAPLKYPEEFTVRVLVEAKGPKSITYAGSVHHGTGAQGPPAAVGSWKVVRVRREPGAERIKGVEMPKDVNAALTVAPEDIINQLKTTDR